MKKQILLSLQLLAIIFLVNLGCSTLQTAFQTVRIVPVFDPEATILPRSGTVAYVKNGITAMAVPLNDVKAVDAFGIIVFNSTDHWISVRQEDCSMLDQSGKVYKPIHRSQHTFYLGKNFTPKMPPEFREDFRENRVLRSMGDLVPLPTEDIEKQPLCRDVGCGSSYIFTSAALNLQIYESLFPKSTANLPTQKLRSCLNLSSKKAKQMRKKWLDTNFRDESHLIAHSFEVKLLIYRPSQKSDEPSESFIRLLAPLPSK